MSHIVFETNRLIVRQFEAGDGDAFFSINGDPEVMKYIRPAKTREACDQFLHEVLLLNREGFCLNRFAVVEKESGQFVGTFALIPVGDSRDIQIGYAFLPKYWGLGFAKELTRAGISYFFRERKEDRLFAISRSENESSHKVLLACGFREERRYIENDQPLVSYVLYP